ncbi:sensor histidine kinase [Flavivirga spongiicola]|uniref:Histidine kinase n=1 Tax=Flavivirga spongiicola TaxID=421621 RepID=A0ABU7XZ09_9FLAO|nr:histidine kinase [Flavivirga sp. MEBiC05379]MDO5980788.1 histidine kinase [Flavivirga sp. MEBiC05379]
MKSFLTNRSINLIQNYNVASYSLKGKLLALYKNKVFIISTVIFVLIFTLYKLYNDSYLLKTKYLGEIKHLNLKLKLLQLQMNPHFVFNTIGGIESLFIKKNEKEINRYVGSLTSLMRKTLDICNKDSITIGEEIEYLKLYINLMRFRLNNNLKAKYNIDKTISLENKIGCMLFQPIVENAIIHGLAPKSDNRELIISFNKKGNLLIGIVKDNGVGRKAAFKKKKEHTSWATKSIEERIKIFNQIHDQKVKYKFKDLTKNGLPSGSLVKLIIPLV